MLPALQWLPGSPTGLAVEIVVVGFAADVVEVVWARSEMSLAANSSAEMRMRERTWRPVFMLHSLCG